MASIDILNWSGMLQTTTSSFLRRNDQLELAINVHGDTIGSVTKRLGYSTVGTNLGGNVQGLSSYARLANGATNLFSLANGVLRYWNGTIQTAIQSGLSTTAKAEFRTFVDQSYMVGANTSNTYLTSANINGTTYSTSNNLSGAPNARYIEVFRGQL